MTSSSDVIKKIKFLIFELEKKLDHHFNPKFHEESEFDIFEGQGPSRDPLKRSRDQKIDFFIFELEQK